MGSRTIDELRKLLHLPDVEYGRESIRRRKWQEPLPAALQKLREYQWQARNKYSPSELFVLHFLPHCKSFGNTNGRHATSIALPNFLSYREKPRKTIAMKRFTLALAFTIIHLIRRSVTASCGATLAGVRGFVGDRWNHQTSPFTSFMPMN